MNPCGFLTMTCSSPSSKSTLVLMTPLPRLKPSLKICICRKITRPRNILLHSCSYPPVFSGVKPHSYAEHIMDSLNISRTTWSTMKSPSPCWHSVNSLYPLTPVTGNNALKKPTPLLACLATLAPPEAKERLLSPRSPLLTFPLNSVLTVS